MRVADKVIIVTGGASGIGRSTVLTLAREGARVAIADVNLAAAQQVQKEVEEAGGQAMAVQVDVSRLDQAQAMARQVTEAFGRVDVLVNNAGIDIVKPFVQSTPEEWDKIININYKGVINCTRSVLDQMIERGSGKIVSVASDAGRVGSSGEVVYSGTKGAIIAFSKALAREVARYKINVNCVAPGPTDTPLFQGMAGENAKLGEALKKAIPWGRLADPQDIANAILFFASDEASYITGQTLSVSGGLTMI